MLANIRRLCNFFSPDSSSITSIFYIRRKLDFLSDSNQEDRGAGWRQGKAFPYKKMKKNLLALSLIFLFIFRVWALPNPAFDEGHEENTPLYFGNPSDASGNLEAEDVGQNYLMEKAQFSLSYNSETLNPAWVAWHLCAADLGKADRSDSFRPDAELPEGWYAVRKNDYKFPYYGFEVHP